MITNGHVLWIDVTDLSKWGGHFGGTQRVTYELAARFNKSREEVKFFVYDEHHKEFLEASFDIVSSIVAPLPQDGTPSKKGFHRPSIKGVVRAQSIRAYHNLPYSLKRRLTPKRKDQLKKFYRKANTLAANMPLKNNGINKAILLSQEPVVFGPNDTVLILGKPWDTMSFIDVLRLQKLKNGFTLTHLVYDMIPSFLPHVFGKPLPENYTKYMFEAMSITDHVLAISESTKQDVIRFCSEELIEAPEISVIRLGDNPIEKTDVKTRKVANLEPGDFILCVGTVEVRKNHALLYAAYREAHLRKISLPKLVIVGGKGWYTSDILYEFANDPVTKDLVRVMHKIDDSQLGWLYENCRLTIYPSVYEGWGLPIAESLSYGKMCIASKTSSQTEIAGDLIDYFSPYDAVGCLQQIEKYLDDEKISAKEAEIKSKYKPTTWQETYQQAAKVVFK